MNSPSEPIEAFDLQMRLECIQENIEAMEKAMGRKKDEYFLQFKQEVETSIEEIKEKIKMDHMALRLELQNLGKIVGELGISYGNLKREQELLNKKKWYQFNA